MGIMAILEHLWSGLAGFRIVYVLGIFLKGSSRTITSLHLTLMLTIVSSGDRGLQCGLNLLV